MLLIVVRHYLTQSDGLLVLSRTATDQSLVLLHNDCLPYPETASQARVPFANFTLDQMQTLIAYHDLIQPHESEPQQTQTQARPDTIVHIPSGPFQRGSGETVSLEAFSIDIYEVTNVQYQQFIEAGGYEAEEHWSDEGWRWLQGNDRRQPRYWENEPLNAPDRPVVGVSWYEAEAYCRWADKTLPTELQWEKACRGTDGRKFPWGNEPLAAMPMGKGGAPDQATSEAPAAMGSAAQTQSPYGVHNLADRTHEWIAISPDAPDIAPHGGVGDSVAPQVGCNVRYKLLPSMTANFIGFRCQAAAR